ncbi:MAG: hypothetical protein ACJ748_16680 [Flavisolibacter sp.]
MGQQYLTIYDLLLSPFYLLLLSYLGKRHRDKKYPVGHPLRKYYLPGLYVKFAGAIFIALIYQYYYGFGDTFNFFYHAKVINSALDDSFVTWIKLLFRTPVDSDPKLYPYVVQMFWYNEISSYTVSSIAAVLGLLNFTSYIPIALLFAYFSYSGIWAMYRTFTRIYPNLTKELALAFLFVPSTVVWGSGLFKDTICMFGLGWMTHCVFRLFLDRDVSMKNFILIALSFYLIGIIKLYILLAFLPALGLWLLLSYSHKIRSSALRWMVNIIFVGICVGGFFFFTNYFSKSLDEYSLDKVAQTAEKTRVYIGYMSDIQEGSGYDLGKFDPSIGGMLLKFPQAVVVTLFRPFLWEVRKPIVALSALEGLVFLYFTLRLFYKRGFTILKWTIKDPNLIFFFVFSLIFAFAVGISTYNFGSLSRYKIPCMPFYSAFLIILINREKMTRKVKLKVNKLQPKWAQQSIS